MGPLSRGTPTVLSEPGRSLTACSPSTPSGPPAAGAAVGRGRRAAASARGRGRCARPGRTRSRPPSSALAALHPGKPTTLTLLLPSRRERAGRLTRAGPQPAGGRRARRPGAAPVDGARAGRRRRRAGRPRRRGPLRRLGRPPAGGRRAGRRPGRARPGAAHPGPRGAARRWPGGARSCAGSTRSRSRHWSRRCPRSGGRSRPARATPRGADPHAARRRRARRAHRRRRARPAGPRRPVAARARRGRARQRPRERGVACRAAHPRRPGRGERAASWTQLADALFASGTRSARAPPAHGRACFRLAEVRTLPRPVRPRRRPRRPDRRRHPLDAGVLPAVHRRPEPAGARRAGLVRPRRTAAGRPAGAAARRAGPGRAGAARHSPRRCARRRPEVAGPRHERRRTSSSPPTRPLLVDAGFGVQLPAGWDGSRRVGLTLSARSTPADRVLTRGGLGREELADFRWSVAVGDEELSRGGAGRAGRGQGPSWCGCAAAGSRVDAERLARRAGVPASRAPRSAPTPRVGGGAGARAAPPRRLGGRRRRAAAGHRVHAEGWIGDLLEGRAERTIAPVEPPAGFRATLRPYQQRGAVLAGVPRPRSGSARCLADDMGLGKTVQLLALEATERARGRDTRTPTLLLCPMSLVGTWQREAAQFAPEPAGARAPRPEPPARRRRWPRRSPAADLVVTTYATATRDVDELAAVAWRRLVLDEAQAVKNSRRRPRPRGAPVRRRAPGRAHRHPGGEPARGAVVGDGRAQPRPARQRRCVPRPLRRPDRAARQRRGRRRGCARSPGPTCCAGSRPIRRSSTTCPRRSRSPSTTGSPAEQASLYRTVVDDMMEKIEDSQGIQRRGNVLAAMAKLKQVCNHPAHLLHDGSPDRAALGQGRPAGGDPRRDPRRGRPGPVLHPVHRVRPHAGAAPVRALRHRRRVPARRHAEEAPRRDGRAVPGAARARRSCCSR